MKQDVSSPGITTGEEMNECQSTEEKVAGKDKHNTSEEQGKNTSNIGCGTPALEEEHTPSYVKLQPPDASDQLVTGRKFTISRTSPLSLPVSLGCSDSSADQADFHPSDSLTADVECLVCFNQYSCSRPPKVLACRHVFCAACLKLLLWNEDNTWSVACPICREVTTVFGGLICSLPDKAGITHLTDPGPNAEMVFPQDAQSGTLVVHSTFSISQGNRVAAKRLLFLLLLLVILIAFILPFVYGGLMKWVLCVAVALGLIGAGVLCCNPSWQCRCCNVSPLFWQTNMSHITSAA